MEPQPRIHDNSKIMLTVQVYYERTIIKGEQRGYEQQGQGEMTKENKGKWKIIENNNNTKGLPLHTYTKGTITSFLDIAICQTVSVLQTQKVQFQPTVL